MFVLPSDFRSYNSTPIRDFYEHPRAICVGAWGICVRAKRRALPEVGMERWKVCGCMGWVSDFISDFANDFIGDFIGVAICIRRSNDERQSNEAERQ